MSGPRKPGQSGPGADRSVSLAARPGYEVGYAKPPESAKFRKGVSGNPRGRPKGAKNKLPALNEERMKAIILEEAYRTITVRDGTKNVTVPIARAVLRSLAVNAVKGQHRSQRLFSELLASVETSNRAKHDDWLKTAIDYKIEWDVELARRKRLGITDAPAPLPHPDHVVIDLRAGTARLVGPATREEQAEWEKWIERRQMFEEDLEEFQQLLEDATEERDRIHEGGNCADGESAADHSQGTRGGEIVWQPMAPSEVVRVAWQRQVFDDWRLGAGSGHSRRPPRDCGWIAGMTFCRMFSEVR